MIDIEKVEEALHTLYIGNPNDVEEEYKTVKTELERLQQKETPMKVVHIKKDERFNTFSGVCPNCKWKLHNNVFEKHCMCCGQSLDWSDER